MKTLSDKKQISDRSKEYTAMNLFFH